MINQYKTKLIKKDLLSGSVYHFTFQLVEPKEIDFLPGQYLFLRLDGKTRLYSIASPAYEKEKVEFIVELIPGGLASEYLKRLSLGEEVIWQGPAGLFCFKDNYPESIFLATGTGIAPIRSIIHSKLKSQDFNFFLLWGLRCYDDIYFFDEFKDLEQKLNGRFKFVLCLSRERSLSIIREEDKKYFFLGHIQNYLEKNFSDAFRKATFYLCGGREVVESLKEYLIGKKVNQEQIVFEQF